MRFLSLLTTLLLAALVSACGGGGGSAGTSSGSAPAALFTTAPATLTLAAGVTGGYQISGGSPPYVASSSDSTAVAASISSASLSLIGMATGSAIVVIKDTTGASVSVAVTVPAPSPLATTAQSAITIAKGDLGTYTISGGNPPYVVSSSNVTVATATVSGASLTINAVGGGAASIAITDAKNAGPVAIAVTVPAPAALSTTALPSVTIVKGEAGSYSITGGTPPYVVSSSNASVATALVNGGSLTISAVSAGGASILVGDSKGSAPVTIAVTVPAPDPLRTSAPTALTLGAGLSLDFSIAGGTPPYTAVSSNATLVSASATGSVLSLFGVRGGGPVPVLIIDKLGSQLTVSVTVPGVGTLYTMAPPSVTVSGGQVQSFSIVNGTAPFVVSSSNESVAKASVSGSFLSITGVGPGVASIVLNDSAGSAAVTIAVTVPDAKALFTTAPSAVTIGVGLSASYLVSGGTAPYVVSSSNSAVATASVNTTGFSPAAGTITISGLAAGAANIVLTDAKGASITLGVAVGTSNAFAVNAPGAISMGVTSVPRSFVITGGVAPYSAISSDDRVATGTVSGATLTITPLKGGLTSIQVFDSSGKSVTISVTVDGSSGSTSANAIEILPSTATLSSAAGSTVSFIVTVKDQANTTLPNQTVTFTATSGNLVGASPSPATGANGSVSTVTLSPGADPTNRLITVTATVGAATKSIVMPVVGSTVSISGPGSTLLSSGSVSYSLKATDSGGRPVSGVTLTVSSALGNQITQPVPTDSSGVATVSFTPNVAGTDTLNVSGLGAKGQTTVAVSNEDLAFTLPAPGTSLSVSTTNSIKIRYRVGGVGVAGQPVTFSSTRGSVTPASATTDALGEATVQVSSTTAGPATLSAQLGTARTTLDLKFVATVPATVFLQANPSAVFPNAPGSVVNQSSLSATVRDAVGNPVAGQVVNFTAVNDSSNGFITPGSVITDTNGVAAAQFVPGGLSTPANGVILRASVQGAAIPIESTASLTVNGSASFISIGLSNDLTVVDRQTYGKSFSVYVTDVNGAPVANKAITLSVLSTSYGKGFLVYDKTLSLWIYSSTSPTICANEDLNRNGILDSGEDVNGDGRLTPGSPVVLMPAVLTTDATGYATFLLNFGKNYAYWLSTEITAKASVAGTESSKTISYALQMLFDDAKLPSSPANQVSPFGIETSCANPN